MLTAYIDETISQPNPGHPGEGVYYVAAMVVDAKQEHAIAEGLATLKAKVIEEYGLPADLEFHGYEMFQYRKGWKKMAGKHHESSVIYADAMRIAADSGVTVVMSGVHMEQLSRQYLNPRSPHELALQFCLERVNAVATRRGSKVRVVADEVNNQEAHERRIELYKQTGASLGYYGSRFEAIEFPFEWAPSHLHYGLQMIDMIAFICNRAERMDSKRKTKADRAIRRIVSHVSPLMTDSEIWYPAWRGGRSHKTLLA